MTTSTTTNCTQADRDAEFVQLLAQVAPEDFAEVLGALEAIAAEHVVSATR